MGEFFHMGSALVFIRGSSEAPAALHKPAGLLRSLLRLLR